MRQPVVLIAPDALATRALGRALGQALAEADLSHALTIALNGELGAGKTTFASGLLHALGVEGPVRSPTYTLIEPYEVAGMTVYHLDLYRLNGMEELEDLGIRELFTPGSVLLVEWAERGGAALARPDLEIRFAYRNAEDITSLGRKLELLSGTESGADLVIRIMSSTANP